EGQTETRSIQGSLRSERDGAHSGEWMDHAPSDTRGPVWSAVQAALRAHRTPARAGLDADQLRGLDDLWTERPSPAVDLRSTRLHASEVAGTTLFVEGPPLRDVARQVGAQLILIRQRRAMTCVAELDLASSPTADRLAPVSNAILCPEHSVSRGEGSNMV